MPDHILIEDCEVFDCVRHNINRNIQGWQNAIATGGDDVTVQRCYVHENYGEGIILGGRRNLARENVVHDNFSCGIYLDGAADSRVERNLIFTRHLTAFYSAGAMVAGPGSGIQVADEINDTLVLTANTITDNLVLGGRAGFYYGDYLNGGGFKNSVLSHNAFYASHPADAAAGWIHFDLSGTHTHSNSVAQANLIALTTGGTLVSVSGGASGLTFSDNGWSPSGGGVLAGAVDTVLTAAEVSWLQAVSDFVLGTADPKALIPLLVPAVTPPVRGPSLRLTERLGRTAGLVAWRAARFTPARLNAGDATDMADPDADSLSNLFEYALGAEPLVADSGAFTPAASIVSNRLRLTFTRARADLTYTVQATSDLVGTWSDLAANPGTVSLTTPVTVADTVDITTANPARRFLRLKITTP